MTTIHFNDKKLFSNSKYRRKLTSEMKCKLHSKLYERYFTIYNCVTKRKENQDLITFSKAYLLLSMCFKARPYSMGLAR